MELTGCHSPTRYMVADYIGVTYNKQRPFGIFIVAKSPSRRLLERSCVHHERAAAGGNRGTSVSSKGEKPVPGAESDHEMKFYYDDEGQRPIPPSRLIPPPK